MSHSLYHLAEQYKDLQELEDVDEQTLADTLEGLSGEFAEKAVAVIAAMKNLGGVVGILDCEIKRLQTRLKQAKAAEERLKQFLKENMQKTGIKKIDHDPVHKATLGKPSQVVVITNVKALPMDCVKIVTTEDPIKAAIAKKLKAGTKMEGAHLVSGEPKLTIR